MNDKVRKTLPLVGAIALTSSALLAGTGGVAAKQPPLANFNSPHCATILGDADYDVSVDFSGNKGKWVFVSVDVETLDGRKIHTNHSTIARHDMKKWLFVEATDEGQTAEAADAVVKVWNRKGVLQNEQRMRIC